MSSIEAYGGGGGLVGRDARRTGRSVSRQHANSQIRTTAADIETDLAITKIENATMATGTGMTAVVRVAKAQEQLELMAPAASARLNFLADDHALGVAEALQSLRCKLRRI
jgi:hypothetical protein